MKLSIPVALIAILGISTSCSESPKKIVTEEKPVSISVEDQALWAQAQSHFQALEEIEDYAGNPTSPEKVELGKMLYFDTRLSKNGNNSCNSCHNMETYGVDNEATSKGDAGKRGVRNSPTVLNAALANMQFWDGRAKNVEEQAGMPILNPVEMAIPSKEFLVKRLSSTKEYPALFAKAFPNETNSLTYDNLSKALGAFERTLITPCRFDDFLAKDPSHLDSEEKEGLTLFIETGCTQCHSGVGLGGGQMQKFGVHDDYRKYTKSKTNDIGRMEVTNQAIDKDIFKVPTLRNIAKTGPYFHDGSVSDLNEAVRIMAKTQLNKDLTDDQIVKISKFLHALTGEVPKSALPSVATTP